MNEATLMAAVAAMPLLDTAKAKLFPAHDVISTG
jgi:hypothetical protein